MTDQVDQLLDHRRGVADLALIAVQREDVAAEPKVAPHPALELAKHRVLGARQLGGDAVVEGELPTSHC
jgi:hypothetical protein